jgi:thiamine-monophosphate kinase
MSDTATNAEDRGRRPLSVTGEADLIAALVRRLPQAASVLLGPGDDAAVVTAPDGRVVAACDVLVEGVHFARSWSTAYDVGRKAAAANMADVAAMGAMTTGLLVALVAPDDLETSWALELADGLADEAGLVGASVVGGDVSRGPCVVVAVTALGDLNGRAPVTRGGARPGDVVALCGTTGRSAAGLAVLERGFGSPRALVAAHRRPSPPYASGPAASDAGATAMVDVSDGLVSDLGQLARSSGVTIEIDKADVPLDPDVASLASAYGRVADEWLFTGGEDHALVATFASGAALPDGFTAIGRVRVAQAGEPTVLVDGREWSGRTGHRHWG